MQGINSCSILAVLSALPTLRLVWLDYAWEVGHAIWLQQVSNGATLLFAFFMISEPMTTPQRRGARMAYAIGVAGAAFVWQYLLFKPHRLILMLAAASISVPLINRRWPQRRFESVNQVPGRAAATGNIGANTRRQTTLP